MMFCFLSSNAELPCSEGRQPLLQLWRRACTITSVSSRKLLSFAPSTLRLLAAPKRTCNQIVTSRSFETIVFSAGHFLIYRLVIPTPSLSPLHPAPASSTAVARPLPTPPASSCAAPAAAELSWNFRSRLSLSFCCPVGDDFHDSWCAGESAVGALNVKIVLGEEEK